MLEGVVIRNNLHLRVRNDTNLYGSFKDINYVRVCPKDFYSVALTDQTSIVLKRFDIIIGIF